MRITTAPQSAAVDLARRRRQYVVSMTARSVCFLGAVLAGPGVLRWVLIAAAVLLPSFAVIAANAAMPRKPGSDLQPGASDRRELAP